MCICFDEGLLNVNTLIRPVVWKCSDQDLLM